MTGFDTEWNKVKDDINIQEVVMTVHFRPDKEPKDKAQWYEWLSNYAHTTANLIKIGVIK